VSITNNDPSEIGNAKRRHLELPWIDAEAPSLGRFGAAAVSWIKGPKKVSTHHGPMLIKQYDRQMCILHRSASGHSMMHGWMNRPNWAAGWSTGDLA
jgi:hypothetical protein